MLLMLPACCQSLLGLLMQFAVAVDACSEDAMCVWPAASAEDDLGQAQVLPTALLLHAAKPLQTFD
jgi:hypothetical protein